MRNMRARWLLTIGVLLLPAFQNCSGFSATSSDADSALAEKSIAPFSLQAGQSLTFGSVALALGTDGNVRLTQGAQTLWTSGTTQQSCASGCALKLTGDGTLSVTIGSTVSWTNGVTALPGRYLVLSETPPYMRIANADATIAWAPRVPLVFFTVVDPYANYGTKHGVSDFDALFTEGAAWPTGLAHVNVVKFYAQFLDQAPDAELTKVFNFLAAHKIALAIEIGLLHEGTDGCGSGIEGYVGQGIPLRIATRIKALGGDLRYASIDESFGATQNPSGCLVDIATAAVQVATKYKTLQSVFPAVQLGDTENLPGAVDATWFSNYLLWVQTINANTTASLAYFHHDVDWADSTWSASISYARTLFKKVNLPYGIIQNATAGATSDADWVSSAENNILRFKNAGFAAPDQIVFQNWDPYPSHALPETDPTAQTAIIPYYYSVW